MTSRLRFLICALAFAVITGTAVTSCSQGNTPPAPPDIENPGPIEPLEPPTEIAKAAAKANNAFGLELGRKLHKPGKNLLISPTSIAMAMHLAAGGAGGDTRAQMLQALRMPGLDLEAQGAHNQALLLDYNHPWRGVQLHIANSLWADSRRMQLLPQYRQWAETYLHAQGNSLDFTGDKAPGEINGWCAQKTNNLIPRILDEIPADAVAYLVNAVYFKGDWAVLFNEKDTSQQPFYMADGKTKDVPLMMLKDNFGHVKHDGFTTVTLRYGNKSALSFIVALPDKDKTIRQTLDALDAEKLYRAHSADPTEGTVELPRFRLEYAQELRANLAEMGMKQAFDPATADFSRLGTSTQGSLYISQVLHKAVIEVNETGSEAAAVTAVEIILASAEPDGPWRFRADRPFVFAIYDGRTGGVLFLGACEQP